jgi:hypothetical protein
VLDIEVAVSVTERARHVPNGRYRFNPTPAANQKIASLRTGHTPLTTGGTIGVIDPTGGPQLAKVRSAIAPRQRMRQSIEACVWSSQRLSTHPDGPGDTVSVLPDRGAGRPEPDVDETQTAYGRHSSAAGRR